MAGSTSSVADTARPTVIHSAGVGAVQASGDFDGDGYGDIAIGHSDWPNGNYPESGKVYIYLTSDWGL